MRTVFSVAKNILLWDIRSLTNFTVIVDSIFLEEKTDLYYLIPAAKYQCLSGLEALVLFTQSSPIFYEQYERFSGQISFSPNV
eukprot:snap_masked-scaffold_23-processed-gene-3.16-mRNA-1 protein AED:1.00 eAED:1.00 QI:0/0/0/0/1/1/2/0/82